MKTSTDLSQSQRITEVPVTRVPLLDIPRELDPLRAQIDTAISRVMDSHQFILGPEADALEAEIASLCQVDHAICCASGSDALLLALMALDIGPGDEVILPSFTFFATASAVWRLGAKPVFVDIDPIHFNLCTQSFEQSITSRTKAVIPVHLYGQCCDMTEINTIAQRHKVRVIEDAAQALNAKHAGRPAGSWGDLGCFSFYPTKNLGACGDAGIMVTQDGTLAKRLRLLRAHGMEPRYYHREVGINSRLDAMQAAILRVKLPQLSLWTRQRQHNAASYDVMFAAAGLDRFLVTPTASHQKEHVWNQYTIRVKEGQRDSLRDYLTTAQVGSEIYYPVPLHRQACFASLEEETKALPVTEVAAQEALSLPVFPGLTEQEQLFVVNHIADFYDLPRI
jgi:dTDP-4-amino-4,6-dideoxygalactose transaminase